MDKKGPLSIFRVEMYESLSHSCINSYYNYCILPTDICSNGKCDRTFRIFPIVINFRIFNQRLKQNEIAIHVNWVHILFFSFFFFLLFIFLLPFLLPCSSSLKPLHKVLCHSKIHHLFPDVSIYLHHPLARLPRPLLLFTKVPQNVLHVVITGAEGQMNVYESHIPSAHTRESGTDFSLQWHHSPNYTASPT